MAAPQIVFDEWNTYVAERDGVTMFISFDEAVTRDEPPADLQLCARVILSVKSPNDAGGPVSPEAELLWQMEDDLTAMLEKHRVPCRLVGRLTYQGLREIVFQLQDWDSFRPPVGLWMMQHEDYEIDVSEHEGWDFFDDVIRPRIEDRLFMADRDVVQALIESGSDPEKEHSLEYFFVGEAEGLRRVAQALRDRGYTPLGELDYASGQIALAKRLALDLMPVVAESLANHELAEEAGVEFTGWGAAIVK
jgi:regulator of RNase E activity RraB